MLENQLKKTFYHHKIKTHHRLTGPYGLLGADWLICSPGSEKIFRATKINWSDWTKKPEPTKKIKYIDQITCAPLESLATQPTWAIQTFACRQAFEEAHIFGTAHILITSTGNLIAHNSTFGQIMEPYGSQAAEDN